MGLKLYLNKFLKVDNIEGYSYPELITLKKEYEKFLEESEGSDPDFPMIHFGNKGEKIKGTNIHTVKKPVEEETEEDKFIYGEKDKRDLSVNERALNFLKNLGMK